MLELSSVSKIYGQGTAQVVALNDISLRIKEGDFVAVTGPSGSGKSTLLNVVGGLDRVSAGEVILDGKRIDNMSESKFVDIRRNKIAYIFQQYHLIHSLSAWENILLPLTFHGSQKDDEERVREVLKKVGLEKRATHKPGQLSGGEQQRVAIARALVNNCSLILADEPTGNLDQKTGMEILSLFDHLNESGYTIMMVTHSPDIAGHASREVHLMDGAIVSIRDGNQNN